MTEQIRLIEELAMNAWPAELIEPLDGWWMRWHRMTSRRVNSVWPNAWGGRIPLAIKLEKVEQFYMLREQPARYQICPAALPEGLDDVLEVRQKRQERSEAAPNQLIGHVDLPFHVHSHIAECVW